MFDAIKSVFRKPDGSFNWLGTLVTACAAIGGALLFPQAALVAGLAGAAVGVAANHFLIAPKAEPAHPDAARLPGMESAEASKSREILQEAGLHVARDGFKHNLPHIAKGISNILPPGLG